MRLTPKQLEEITGLKTPSAQARWMKQHFGILPPTDKAGPILTEAAFGALVMKRLGIVEQAAEKPRPQLKLKEARP